MDIRPPGEFDWIAIKGFLSAMIAPVAGYVTAILKAKYDTPKKSWKQIHIPAALVAMCSLAAWNVTEALGISPKYAVAASVYMGLVGIEYLANLMRRFGDNHVK
ncbi:MAG TPA: phage holin family protein [Pseudomonadales bacterium]|nr:phage holin family protein [Pseudomonadales bacterium]